MTTSVQVPAPLPGAAPERGGRGLRRVLGALAGLLAAAVALGVAELVAGIVGPASSPVVAVGDAAITLTPEAVKHFAITTFGENDKVALVAGTLALIAVYALRDRAASVCAAPASASSASPLFGLIGAVAALTRPEGGLLDALPSVLGAAAGASPSWSCSPR